MEYQRDEKRYEKLLNQRLLTLILFHIIFHEKFDDCVFNKKYNQINSNVWLKNDFLKIIHIKRKITSNFIKLKNV